MDLNDLTVKCYSGYTYAEEPQSFRWQGAEYQVKQIEKAWQEPGKRCFQVWAGGNKLFQLCYNETEQRWSVTEVVRR
ncbi:hypothetical protein ACFLXD_01625 [Chloroflexota bacterium]